MNNIIPLLAAICFSFALTPAMTMFLWSTFMTCLMPFYAVNMALYTEFTKKSQASIFECIANTFWNLTSDVSSDTTYNNAKVALMNACILVGGLFALPIQMLGVLTTTLLAGYIGAMNDNLVFEEAYKIIDAPTNKNQMDLMYALGKKTDNFDYLAKTLQA